VTPPFAAYAAEQESRNLVVQRLHAIELSRECVPSPVFGAVNSTGELPALVDDLHRQLVTR
jgi:hypothetical protein